MNKTNQNLRLKNLPISIFSIILGISGFTIATQKIEMLLLNKFIYSYFLIGFDVMLLVFLCVIYSIKIFLYMDEVKKEVSDLMKNSFFSTTSISLLLLSIIFLDINTEASRCLFITGAVLHLLLTLVIITLWIQKDVDIKYISPIWFMPAVGNVLIPISGQVFYPDISWFFFSVGIFFWLILVTLLFYRLIFTHQLHDKLVPTLFILLAPPSVSFISYVKLAGDLDSFAKILYYIGLFILLLLLFSSNMFYNLKFYLSWWAYSFPISTFIVASMLMFKYTDFLFFKIISLMLYVILSFLMVMLVFNTIKAVLNKEICVE